MAARLTSFVVVAIVAGTLIAGLIVGAQRDDSDGPVDLIVHNAVVFTGDDGDMPEAVAVRANQILKVGSNREILRMQRPQTVTIDAQGAAVVPGFNDAHLHLVRGGLTLDGVDLGGAATVADAVALVKAWADAHPATAWIVGHGWSNDLLEGEERPARQLLDAIAAGRPVQLVSETGDVAWVNSRALELAGIGRRTADPEDGRIVRDLKGDAVGILEGTAVARIEALLPKPTQEERTRALFAAIAEAQRNGITSLQNADGAALDFELLDAARKEGAVAMRVYAALPVHTASTDEDVASLDEVLKQYPDDPLFKAGGAKVAMDGIDGDALNKLVRLLDARGWQVMIEADSPEEADMAETAFAHAERSNGRPVRERRHRIEHLHPNFTAVGDKLALGSDWPNGPLSPMRVLETALPRLTLAQALQAYTVNGAYASYDEQRKGFIKPGMLADLAVLSDDIFSIDPSELGSVKVAYTIFDGRVVYPVQQKRLTIP
ncbi:MAG TPA: amidohydrolase family protein [Vicinamibacterales bacterium]|nr:amidohydrolase family protein [Vicinamibacterales bacterium]